MKKNNVKLWLSILMITEVYSANTRFSGSTSGVFVNPDGGSSYSGTGTDTFTYGESDPNRLSFQGKDFTTYVNTKDTGYIFGSAAQNNRSVFSLGTLDYYNGRTTGGNPSGVQLDISVYLHSPVQTGVKKISSKLNFEITTNDGDKYHNADYLYLPRTLQPIALFSNGGYPISIEPVGFSVRGEGGYTTTGALHVFEEESASAELLAHISSSCESIVKNAVRVHMKDSRQMIADFIPNFNLTLDEAANICGYRGFNWVQYVEEDPYGMEDTYGNKLGPSAYVDPPKGGYPGAKPHNNFPYYNDPNITPETPVRYERLLQFRDIPNDSRMDPSKPIKFITKLVGMRENDQFDILYVWKWETTYNHKAGSGSINMRSLDTDVIDITKGTGGATVTKQDLSAIDIPLNIRNLMQKNGAQNIETFTDIVPLPILFPVLF